MNTCAICGCARVTTTLKCKKGRCFIAKNKEYKRGVMCVQVDAKDLYLSNNGTFEPCFGYSIRDAKGDLNVRRFKAAMDYSLELTKLREVFTSVYGTRQFAKHIGFKYYMRHVVSVTFKFAVKEYNRIRNNIYVKLGENLDEMEFTDNLCIKDGVAVGIHINEHVERPAPQEVLGKYFYYEDGCYKVKTNIKTVHSIYDLRKMLYDKGFYLDGIHFVRYKRSAGSARVGKCMFIAEPLYRKMHKWELCGLNIKPGKQVDLAALESYIALPMSSSIGEIELNPKHILVIDDYKSVFKDTVVNVKDVDDKLVAAEEEVEIANAIWDGQALIDPSAMGEYAKFGFILLRNRFFKSAAFNFNLQQFFADHNITDVSQLKGYTQAEHIEDIKLITTPSSIKYCKFGTVEQWMDNVDSIFAVVKHEKKTHYMEGRLVQAHYQLLNTLQLSREEVAEFMQPTLEYMRLIKAKPSVMRYHIKFNNNYDTDEEDERPATSNNDIVYKMLGITDEFAKTKIYANFKKNVLESFTRNVKTGHVFVNGNYSTLCGNPVEMALAAIGQFDGESVLGAGNIYSTRFPFGARLLGSRSPHVTMGNVWLTNNKWNEQIERYVNVTPEIVVVNSIGENLLSRLSGAD